MLGKVHLLTLKDEEKKGCLVVGPSRSGRGVKPPDTLSNKKNFFTRKTWTKKYDLLV